MSKTITLRLLEKKYEKISTVAKSDHRPISNFITTMVMEKIKKIILC